MKTVQHPKKFVFLGPSLSEREARTLCPEAIFLPPAKCGDFLEVLKLEPTHILLIDGFFEAVPASWHKEILFVMTRGVEVMGAASMGALRAAELAAYGMRGIGKIYEDYEKGITRDDSEVAMLHLSRAQDYRAMTVPLVNIRSTFGANDPRFKAAQALNYRERLPEDMALIDQKALDARAALKILAEASASSEKSTKIQARDMGLSLYFKGLHQQVFCRAPTLPLSVLDPIRQQHSASRLFGPCYVETVRLAKLCYAHFFLTGEPYPDDVSPPPLGKPSLFDQHRWPELSDPEWFARILSWKRLMQSRFNDYFEAQGFEPAMSELQRSLNQWKSDQNLSTSEAVYAKLESEHCEVEAFEAELQQQARFDYFIERGNLLLRLDISTLPVFDFFGLAFELTHGIEALAALNAAEKERRLDFIRQHQHELKLLNAFEFYREGELLAFQEDLAPLR